MSVVWVCVSSLSLTSFVALSMLSSFSDLHFAHLQNGRKATCAASGGEGQREGVSSP